MYLLISVPCSKRERRWGDETRKAGAKTRHVSFSAQEVSRCTSHLRRILQTLHNKDVHLHKADCVNARELLWRRLVGVLQGEVLDRLFAVNTARVGGNAKRRHRRTRNETIRIPPLDQAKVALAGGVKV